MGTKGAGANSRTVLVEVRALLPSLRQSERRIAEALLADPEGFATRSMAEIAELADTSTTTVVRFTRRAGYARFRDLRHDLTEQNLRERLASSAGVAPAADISPGDSLSDVVAKIAMNETLSIADTAEILDIDALAAAVEAIAGAARVDIHGIGASSVVGVDLQRKLSRIGRIALEWPEAHAAWTAAAVLDEQAVAIAISHSGSTAGVVEFLRIAKATGATTIAITNHERSPLAALADIVLRTAARETPLRSAALGSRIAQLMVVDCVFTGVAQVDYEGSVAAIEKTHQAVLRG
ncbi:MULTISPECIES: MurR/RpiR family transcriptional regulator [unclassified Pseudoclavibacter]|uniref:MurR/RpiR family transcriptional regulator n=1 Tax=unclassified Pseudoclavibacter TaxID=2615177 RepID=UPI001BABB8C5|nr:MurR/RpiR family transcriptional regulator [Pseudoclavibacter sp. Marseille-Q4354]MBS3179212.1 MurR/RpiR family transcriptional regulator [Pseudoclavibacter sp. Marseille-Q4354]